MNLVIYKVHGYLMENILQRINENEGYSQKVGCALEIKQATHVVIKNIKWFHGPCGNFAWGGLA